MVYPYEKYEQAFKMCENMGPGTPSSPLSLARIPDFQSLAQTSSSNEVPVTALTEDMLRGAGLGGSSLTSTQKNVSEFKHIFDCIAKKVEHLLNA